MLADYRNVMINNGFWKTIEKLNEDVSIEAVWERFCESGRIDAFSFEWKEGDEKQPHFYWDSDVFKWIEGACYILSRKRDDNLSEKVEYIIDKIEEHQELCGYFNIYFMMVEPDKRFTDRDMHELYCAGHMFEAATAHYQTTGSRRFLNIATKYADYIEKVFVIDKSAGFITPGHEEIELGLVKLYRATGERRYLDLALFFLKNKGVNDKDKYIGEDITWAQDNESPWNMKSAVGHAVRCLYLLSGMADCAAETKDDTLMEACRRVYSDIADSKMYITGATGSTYIGEAFTIPYDLPNERAYAETCASIALMMFTNRMVKYEKKAKYADVAERAMYNGMLSGISLSGDAFFYENPLEINVSNQKKTENVRKKEHYSILQRQKMFLCSCCPPNLNRVLSSIGNYIYHLEDDECYINQFVDSTYENDDVRVTQKTNYPYDGRVSIVAENIEMVNIRVPEWCEEFKLNKEYTLKDGYAVVYNDGNEIIFDMKMEPIIVEANPEVRENAGKVALTFGPIVYCAESCDNIENLSSLYITDDLNAKVEYSEFFRANVIKVDGYILKGFDGLYRRVTRSFEKCRIKFIPYYGFANRGENNMRVWLNYRNIK